MRDAAADHVAAFGQPKGGANPLHLSRPPGAKTTLRIARRELFLWVALILAVHCLLRLNVAEISELPDAFFQSVISKSAIQLLGWYAVFQLLTESNGANRASTTDLAAAFAASTIPLLEWPPLGWIAATVFSIYVLFNTRGDAKVAAAITILLALTMNGLWGPKFFDVFSLPLLRLDAAAVGWSLSLISPNVTWSDTIITAPGQTIGLYGPCSAFHNLSLALLCWVTITKLMRTHWQRSDIATAIVVSLAVIVLNSLRLGMMTLGRADYLFWHEGLGGTIFAWSTLAAIGAVSLWGAMRTVPAR